MSSISESSISRINAGVGRIVLSSHSSGAVFSELSSTYPLKLLSPRTTQDAVAVVYALTYGGGLVGGDRIKLFVDVELGAVLVLLSQGSTKVFKVRPGQRLASVRADGSLRPSLDDHKITSQHMEFVVTATSALFLLPEPVTCFRSASYSQKQTFHLSRDASAVILDWITSGRKSLGEEWIFSRYHSVNEVWVEGKKVAKDVVLLGDDDEAHAKHLPRRTLNDRLAPYACYATVILYGPLIQPVIGDLTLECESISVFNTAVPRDLIWSLSPIFTGGRNGAVVRVAGKETETVKRWLGDTFRKLELVMGIDMYRKAFA